MARHDDEETTLEGSRFWDAGKIMLVVVFVVGFIAGAFVTNKFIDNNALTTTQADSNSLLEQNRFLDERNDSLYSCLTNYGIDPNSC
ncbi:MAG TPA: hypothetical protein VJH23_03645 [archaeon]|nr:hypothetical protein [archaeon]